MPGAPDPRKVEEIFDAVATLGPGEAARALDAACGGDLDLRAAVERLLRHDRLAAPGFLGPQAALLAEALHARREEIEPSRAEPVPLPEAGTSRLGRFYLLRKLGEGGMGVVYVGYDEALDRRVALKLLRQGSAAEGWLVREAQALGRLAHPNVVTVHEIGEHEGRAFLVMELIAGPTLRTWMEQAPRPIGEILALFVQAGRGLAAAHAAGLVHRDFKPDNVLIGADGRARVVDFGIAALALASAPEGAAMAGESAAGPGDHRAPMGPAGERPDEASPSALALPSTRAGALVGTPAFMAPEQLRGQRATAASDQFSFCVALYRAVYGAAPFAGDDLAALVRSVHEGAPRPPPEGRGVPRWLAPIVLRGLARAPAERFPSMQALLDAIERHLPRHPDLDPALVHRERRLLMAALSLIAVGLATFVHVGGVSRVVASHAALVRIALFVLAIDAAVVALLRRRLAQNLYGRRLAALFVGSAAALLAHRLLAARLGTPVLHVVADDLFVLAVLFATAAVTFERWLSWVAALALAGAAVSAERPAWAPTVLSFCALAAAPVMLVLWSRD